MIMQRMAIVSRLLVGALFFYAGAIKLQDPVAFAGTIAAYHLLPYTGTFLVAVILPWMEALCGLLLIAGVVVRASALLLFMLNTVFIVALGSAAARGLNIDCGCFRSTGAETSPVQAIGRDLLIAAALAFLLWATRPHNDELLKGSPPNS